MKKDIDLLIVNNCPAFYKINLYNELARRCSLHVVFLALTNQVVILDDYKRQMHFSYSVIAEVQIEERDKWRCFIQLYRTVKQLNYKKIIFGGYDCVEFFFLPFLLRKSSSVLQCESSVYESRVSGIKGKIKKILFSRFAFVLPSGTPHRLLFETLCYKGKIIQTGGVGIFNKAERTRRGATNQPRVWKFLYVGRLIPLKNLDWLIEQFNKNGEQLSLVGTGELENELKRKAGPNIRFYGFVPNHQLGEFYRQHDVFILPSVSETWGVVVEEAIYWGVPVIVNSQVGCQVEMVARPGTGIVVDMKKENALREAIGKMKQFYTAYKEKVNAFDFDKRDEGQIQAYLNTLHS